VIHRFGMWLGSVSFSGTCRECADRVDSRAWHWRDLYHEGYHTKTINRLSSSHPLPPNVPWLFGVPEVERWDSPR